ncbi:hypothetical protein EU803_00310 [Loktanella sp. IMCC34160]|uniref:hypothetical protein n=1 Tax=Loktanella sp. IMCC34160 TaxID=2510646 RepID=UPI00101BA8ED|nr:hypothetical protein [Loktanella sp. IMCC34160]RYG92585.1 hypothetical protein EU803_00310 [Loktanella sp. IMCC34160]
MSSGMGAQDRDLEHAFEKLELAQRAEIISFLGLGNELNDFLVESSAQETNTAAESSSPRN